ncbi:Rhs element Vgr family protein [Mycolicibacterium brisbanense]|uniref:Rhs element Vgr family protein n=1 Tax=Mycolicibacterium brisbanense TaxID=146020 RepID=A0A100VWX3_9MYCO|nr:Rhs element Vgr family protein [Mycolicibacterium brisbanense]
MSGYAQLSGVIPEPDPGPRTRSGAARATSAMARAHPKGFELTRYSTATPAPGTHADNGPGERPGRDGFDCGGYDGRGVPTGTTPCHLSALRRGQNVFPAEPSCWVASTSRAAIPASALAPHTRGS